MVIPDEEDALMTLLDSCRNWNIELMCLTYLLSKILERKGKGNADCQQILERIFTLPDEMWLSYQEFDLGFVKYLFRHIRNTELDLETDLINAQNKLSDHVYG
jgi:hypothetical protein